MESWRNLVGHKKSRDTTELADVFCRIPVGAKVAALMGGFGRTINVTGR
jgi:hypothetical protein